MGNLGEILDFNIREAEVAGSNPASPTNKINVLRDFDWMYPGTGLPMEIVSTCIPLHG